jgi:peroxiredoxin
MNRLSVGDAAPDFVLPDHGGNPVKLSEVLGSRNVLLVFNLGFV